MGITRSLDGRKSTAVEIAGVSPMGIDLDHRGLDVERIDEGLARAPDDGLASEWSVDYLTHRRLRGTGRSLIRRGGPTSPRATIGPRNRCVNGFPRPEDSTSRP